MEDNFDDLSLGNVERERLEAKAAARGDGGEFARLVFGDNRTDAELRAAFLNGERTEETRAGLKRFHEHEEELMARRSLPPPPEEIEAMTLISKEMQRLQLLASSLDRKVWSDGGRGIMMEIGLLGQEILDHIRKASR